MKLTPGQMARIERELPTITLDNEMQFRMLQTVLKDWHKTKHSFLCFRIVDTAYAHINELVQDSSYSEFNCALTALRNKISSSIGGTASVIQYLNDQTRWQISPYAMADNAAIIRHRWIVKILLANRERLGIGLDG